MRRTSIRQLRAGEPLPAGEPKRYVSSAGYVRLRWKVAPATYVEVYEHRLVAGLPPVDVHHRNGIKDDNDAANLEPLSRADHMRHHGGEAPRRYGSYRSAEAQQKAERRLEREAAARARTAEMRRMYAEGMSTTEIGQALCLHSSQVSRCLRQAGVLMRPRAGDGNRQLARARQVVHARAGMRCERCGVSVKWTGHEVHHRRPRAMGGTSDPLANDPSNLALLCRDCHRWIESNRAAALADGWLLHQGVDPREHPTRITSV